MKRVGAGIAVLGLALAGCGSGGSAESAASEPKALTAIEAAAKKCHLSNQVQDDGHSIALTIDLAALDKATKHAVCLLGATDPPDYVLDHIDQTRALDGQQTDEWEDFSARWTYHPDDGLNIILVEK